MGLFITAAVIFIVFATAALAGVLAAPYVPTFQRDVRRMLALAALRQGERLADLGAGDGRIVVTAVQTSGVRAVGYEISILPYLIARLRAAIARPSGAATIEFRNFYRTDLSTFDVVTCFLTPSAMEKLRPKFERELRPGTRVVSYAFAVPGWQPTTVEKPTPRSTPVFLYRLPSRAG